MAQKMVKLSLAAVLLAGLAPAAARADFEHYQYPSRMESVAGQATAKVIIDSNNAATAEQVFQATLPFDFTWQGTTYKKNDDLQVSSNGGISFITRCGQQFGGTCLGDRAPNNFQNSINNAPNAYLAPWWGDLDVAKSMSTVRSYKEGTTPNQVFTIEWTAAADGGVTGSSPPNFFAFQVKLYESSNIALLQYGDLTPGKHVSAVFAAAVEAALNAGAGSGTTLLGCDTNCGVSDFPANQGIMIPAPSNAEIVPYASVSNVSAANGKLTLTVTSELHNAGRTSAAGLGYKTYLSSDRVISAASDTQLSSVSAVSLNAESYATATNTLTIDRPAKDGIYYVGVIADTVANEPITANNTISSRDEIVLGKDMLGKILSGSDASGPGEDVSIKIQLTNRGTDDTGNFKFKILLSPFTDGKLRGNEKEVVLKPAGATSLKPGETKTLDLIGTVPANSDGGNFYYWLQIDAPNDLAEAAEDNNIAVGPLLLVTPPDLVMNAFSLTGSPTEVYYGRPLEFEMTISNVGGAVARGFLTQLVASGADGFISATDAPVWEAPNQCGADPDCVGVYAGTCNADLFGQCQPHCVTNNQCPDQMTCYNGVCQMQLEPGEVRTFHVVGTVPTTDRGQPVPPLPCIFGGLVNPSETVIEVPNGGGNNKKEMTTAISCRYPAADAVAREFFAPTRAAAGEAITVFRTIRNQGNEVALVKSADGKSLVKGKIRYEYVLSWNDVVTHKDSILDIVGKGPYGELDLGPNQEDQDVDQIVLPANLATGNYKIGILVDPLHVVDELREDNNVTVAPQALTVVSASLRIVQDALPTSVVGVPILYQLRAIGGDGRYTWSLNPHSLPLPEGLTLSPTGLLATGVDGLTEESLAKSEITVPGNVVFSVNVESGGATDVQTFVLPVVHATGPLTIETGACPKEPDEKDLNFQDEVSDCARRLPLAYVGRPYHATIAASGGQPPYRWIVKVSGNGITADGNVLSGQADTGGLPVTVDATVQDARGVSTNRKLTIRVVNPAELTILTNSVPDADVGVAYVATFFANGGNEATRYWVIDQRKLPPGLVVDPACSQPPAVNCKLSGTPTKEGLYIFLVMVRDADANSDESYFSINVKESKTFSIQTHSLPPVVRGNDYLQQLRATTDVTWSIAAGALPEGLELTESGEVKGTVPETAKTGEVAFAAAAEDKHTHSRQVVALAIDVLPKPMTLVYKTTTTGCEASGGLPSFAAVLTVLGLAVLRRRR